MFRCWRYRKLLTQFKFGNTKSIKSTFQWCIWTFYWFDSWNTIRKKSVSKYDVQHRWKCQGQFVLRQKKKRLIHTQKNYHNNMWILWLFSAQTTDTQWRHKSKISENFGQCGRQNMLLPYLKFWDWDWIFGHAVKATSSLGVRSPSWFSVSSVFLK